MMAAARGDGGAKEQNIGLIEVIGRKVGRKVGR